jgi:hypothetical protein
MPFLNLIAPRNRIRYRVIPANREARNNAFVLPRFIRILNTIAYFKCNVQFNFLNSFLLLEIQ